MDIAEALGERLVDLRDAGGAIGSDLLADGEVQAHVEEGVLAAAFRGVVGGQGLRAGLEQGDVFQMLGYDCGELGLQRLQRLARGVFAPGVQVHLAQLLAVLVGEDWHDG